MATGAGSRPTSIRHVKPRHPQLFWEDYLTIAKMALGFFIAFTATLAIHMKGDPSEVAVLVGIVLGCMYLSRPSAKSINWENEVVLITGGGSGLGAELAQRLAKRTKVVVLTLDPPVYPATPNITSYICDITDRAQIDSVATRLRTEVGEPTIVINNAGVVKGKLLLDLSAEEVQTTFAVNTIAPFWIIQEFLPHMLRERRGHIVNVASVMGLMAVSQMTDYNASKAATVSMHASLRNELDYRYKTREVKTTLVLPGHMRTELFSRTLMPEDALTRYLAGTVTVDTVAAAIEDRLDKPERANAVIRLPVFTHVARLLNPILALVPSPLIRIASWSSGADWAMMAYGPRPDYGERLEAVRKRAD